MTVSTKTDVAANEWSIDDRVMRLREWGTETIHVLPQPPLLGPAEWTIGSAATCALRLHDPTGHTSRLHALRSIRMAATRRTALVLHGDGDLVPIARAIHRRAFGAERPFIVCDPRRRQTRETVRSPENYETGMPAFADAIRELGALHTGFLPADRDWVRKHSASSLPDIEKATLRLVAIRESRNLSAAAARLGMAPGDRARDRSRRGADSETAQISEANVKGRYPETIRSMRMVSFHTPRRSGRPGARASPRAGPRRRARPTATPSRAPPPTSCATMALVRRPPAQHARARRRVRQAQDRPASNRPACASTRGTSTARQILAHPHRAPFHLGT
jgi:hypothetical protein